MTLPIIRLDNNLLGYTPEASSQLELRDEQLPLTQIRITTPTWSEPILSYILA